MNRNIVRIMSIFLLFSLIFSLSACKNSENENIFKDPITVNSEYYLENVQTDAINLYNTSKYIGNFSVAGSESDLMRANYVKERFEEIGLKNVTEENIMLNTWDYEELTIVVNCNCGDKTDVAIRRIGIYPIEFEYDNTKIILSYLKSETDIQRENIENKAVVLPYLKIDKIVDYVNKIKEYNPQCIIYSYYNDTESSMYGINVDKFIGLDIPLFCVPYNSFKEIIYYIEKNAKDNIEITVTLTGKNEINEELVEVPFITGEIQGKNKNKSIYIMANRDNLIGGFMSSCVSVSELITIADRLQFLKFTPDYTIKFVVGTGSQWGLKDNGKNIGIEKYFENIDKSNIQSLLLIDGSYPYTDVVYTQTDVSSELFEKINEYNAKFFEEYKDYRFINVVNKIENPYNFEIPIVIMNESGFSYSKYKNTSSDNNLNSIDEKALNFIINYYTELIKIL